MKWKKPRGRQKRWAKRHLINAHGAVCQAAGNHTIATMREITLDHITPRSLGGGDEIENLQLACRKHNLAKRNMAPEEWEEFQDT